jgi:hypothetical protein
VVVTLTPGDLAVRGRIESARDALSDALDRRADRSHGGGPPPGRQSRQGLHPPRYGLADQRSGEPPSSVKLSVHTDLAAAAVDVTFATHQ